MTKVYFLCTGNSCRSQMAEGFAKKYFPNWTVKSAGVENHGLNPKAVEVMQELNIDISDQYSKLIDEEYLNSSDLVVTLCGDARDKCPMTPPNVKRIHWGLIDPAQAEGTDTEVMDVFRKVRDEINNRVKVMDDVFK